MKLVAKLKLDKATFLSHYKKGVRCFLYNEITFDTEEFKEEELFFYNCSQDRVESTWFTWKENEKILNKYLDKFPNAFAYGKYDFTLAVKKTLYWSNQKSGFIEFARTTKFTDTEVVETCQLHGFNKWKIIVKTIAFKLRNVFKHTPKFNIGENVSNEGKVGIFIKHVFQLQLYKHIVAETKENNSFVFFVTDKEVLNGLETLGVERSRVVLIENFNNSIVRFFLKTKYFLQLNKEDWYIWNQLMLQELEFDTWINIGNSIAKSGISKLLMNEGENGIMGAVLGEIMTKNNIKTYNTMNGMKSGQAQDYFINFDKWFIWDEQMKSLLMKGNYLPESKFIVSGHLMEDEASNHVFQNSLNIEKVKYQNKRIISLFSIRGNREEKIETIKFLEEYLTANNDVFLIIRPHPSEVNNAIFGNLETFDNCFIVNYNSSNSKITLYDQMLISEFSICFGSTVALESKWFGVPCISFEKREKSLIYLIDNIAIKLVHSVKELRDEIVEKKTRKDFANRQNVAKEILKKIFINAV